MENNYQIIESLVGGIQFFEVWGECFSQEDLFSFVGKEQFMCTFGFKPDSDSLAKFGQTITGVIFYSKDELEADASDCKSNQPTIRIVSPMPDLNQAVREDLKYGGFLITDIAYLCFSPYKQTEEHHESGEKKVPNIICIPYEDDPKVDVDKLYQNYLTTKNNAGDELIPYEKEEFVGITLAINNGRIDKRLLSYFGFDIDKMKDYRNIWYHYYKTKERRKTITEEEKSNFADIKFIRTTESFLKLFSEIKKSGVHPDEISRSKPVIQTIISSLSDFEPGILLHGKKQIFWDVDSYLHIVMRHIKQLQIGHFKNKTPIPYKFEDLETLIEKVLGTVGDEIERHFQERPGKDFRRNGKMSILFNGDYYCLHIDNHGRLVTLYVI